MTITTRIARCNVKEHAEMQEHIEGLTRALIVAPTISAGATLPIAPMWKSGEATRLTSPSKRRPNAVSSVPL